MLDAPSLIDKRQRAPEPVAMLRTFPNCVSRLWTEFRTEIRAKFPRLLPASALALLCASSSLCAQSPATPRLLPGGTLYPRVLRLQHGSAEMRGRLIASTDTVIFESTDEGASFTKISKVPVIPGSLHVCCSTLYEVPRDVGSLKAGTLLSAGTYIRGDGPGAAPEMVDSVIFHNGEPAIEMYASTDAGRTWQYLATPVHGGPTLPSGKPLKQRGLWEPEFELAADGSLVMFVSDETDSCCSQKLLRIRTRDGVHWQDKSDVVAMPRLPMARPGMIVSTPLPDGRFLMSYEICGDRFHCDVYTRTSTDGWNFGDPAAAGTRAETASGQFFRHSPSNTFARSGGEGKVLLLGQMLYEKDGSVSPQNGRVFFSSTNLEGKGAWTPHPVPVPVPTAYDNFCPNYSSSLLPSADGSSVLELASDYDAQHRCVTSAAASALK